VWFASRWRQGFIVFERPGSSQGVSVRWGLFEYFQENGRLEPGSGWRYYVGPQPNRSAVFWSWRPRWSSGPGGCMLWIPLWIPFLVLGISTALLCYLDRRVQPGHCPRCRYDLTGITAGVCPECGYAAGEAVRDSDQLR